MIERIDIENLLDKLGVSIKFSGYKYIVEAVLLKNKIGDSPFRIMTLYEVIARKHNSTYSRVERAIRYVYESNKQKIDEYFKLNYKMSNGILIEAIHREVLRMKSEDISYTN